MVSASIVSPRGGKTTIEADKMQFDAQKGKLTADGGVKFKTDAAALRADKAEITVDPAAKKKSSLIFPKIMFSEAALDEVLHYIRAKAKEIDPAKKGVNIVVKHSKESPSAKLSLELSDVPLSELLKYVAKLSGLELFVEGDTYILQTPTQEPPKKDRSRIRVFNSPGPGKP
jgi:hypothetical protein